MAQQKIPDVAIRDPGTRRKLHGLPPDKVQRRILGYGRVVEVQLLKIEGQAGGMRQQLVQGNDIAVGKARQKLAEPVGEPQLAALGQLQHGDGCEVLADGGQGKFGVQGVGGQPLGVGQAVGLLKQHCIVARYEHHAGKTVDVVLALHVGSQPLLHGRLPQAGAGNAEPQGYQKKS